MNFWRLRASYSFLQMELQKSPRSLDIGSAQNIEGSSPRHQVTVQSGFDLSKALNLDLTYRFVSALSTLHIRSYSTIDARFAWRLTRNYQLSLVGQNLLQPYHYEFGSDPPPNVAVKRSVYGQVTWTR